MNGSSRIPELLRQHEAEILTSWLQQQSAGSTGRSNLTRDGDLREQSRAFLSALREAVERGNLTDTDTLEWAAVRDFLSEFSRVRARQGFPPSETATFVMSLKLAIFEQLRRTYPDDAATLAAEVWAATGLLDKLGLYTVEAYQKVRDEIITRQQEELLELSTPVVKLWDGILALPLIGTLDSARTQIVMESLLQQIVASGAGIAIIDITGVPTVDTLVAQHLMKTISAARLMGADCIISGVRPQIAQTIVHLGVELGDVATKATLADAFRMALSRLGKSVVSLEGTR